MRKIRDVPPPPPPDDKASPWTALLKLAVKNYLINEHDGKNPKLIDEHTGDGKNPKLFNEHAGKCAKIVELNSIFIKKHVLLLDR